MAIGRAYRIKKSAVKAYGYTKPPSKKGASRRGPRYAANGSVTHIAAINGKGSYSARKSMSGLSANARRKRAGSALSSAKKAAFAKRMRATKALRKNARGSSRSISARPLRVKRRLPGYTANRRYRAADERRAILRDMPASERALHRKRKAKASKSRRRVGPARRGTTKKSATARRKPIMARKTRRKKKSAARKPVARRVKRRVKRRKSAKRSAVAPKRKRRKSAKKSVARKAAPKRRKRRKAKKTTLKANKRRVKRRRLKRNKGTSAGARKGWRTRRAAKKSPKRRRRAKARKTTRKRRSAKRSSIAPKRRRRSRRKLTANRKRRSSRRTRRAAPKRRSRRLSANRSRRSRKGSRRLRRNGRRRMFRKNGVMEPILFLAKTGGIALAGLLAHKVISNAFTTYALNKIFSTPAVVVATPTAVAPAAATVVPATSGMSGIALDPQYQRLIGSGLVAALGIFAASKLIKDSTVRNTVATGIALSFMTTLASAVLTKFAPSYSGLLAGPQDGTAARLSAMYGLGSSIMPRYQAINGMGEYFQGTSGLGEYFQGATSGLGEYFQGTSGLGLPSYEASAGYGSNPDLMEAAAGMGARETMSTNHVDPHGDLDRELTIAEAAAGVGAYEAAAGMGAISSVSSSSTWIPGSSDGQLWAGTRSISNSQSSTEMTPAGILQTDGGQGVFG